MSVEWPIRIRYTVTEDDRRAINAWYGDPGLATLARCRNFILTHGTAGVEQACESLTDQEKGRADA